MLRAVVGAVCFAAYLVSDVTSLVTSKYSKLSSLYFFSKERKLRSLIISRHHSIIIESYASYATTILTSHYRGTFCCESDGRGSLLASRQGD